MESTLMTKQEVATYLKVSVRTVDRLLENGDLPYHKLKRFIRIQRDDVKAYLDRTRKERRTPDQTSLSENEPVETP